MASDADSQTATLRACATKETLSLITQSNHTDKSFSLVLDKGNLTEAPFDLAVLHVPTIRHHVSDGAAVNDGLDSKD